MKTQRVVTLPAEVAADLRWRIDERDALERMLNSTDAMLQTFLRGALLAAGEPYDRIVSLDPEERLITLELDFEYEAAPEPDATQ